MDTPKNIVVCGPVGAGKSSLVKGLTGKDVPCGDECEGVTKDITSYPCSYKDKNYQVFDIPGFGDIEVDPMKLVEQWNKNSVLVPQ